MLNIKPISELLSYGAAAKLCRARGLKCNTERTFHRYVRKHRRLCRVLRRLPGMKEAKYHLRLVTRRDVERLIAAELAARQSVRAARPGAFPRGVRTGQELAAAKAGGQSRHGAAG